MSRHAQIRVDPGLEVCGVAGQAGGGVGKVWAGTSRLLQPRLRRIGGGHDLKRETSKKPIRKASGGTLNIGQIPIRTNSRPTVGLLPPVARNGRARAMPTITQAPADTDGRPTNERAGGTQRLQPLVSVGLGPRLQWQVPERMVYASYRSGGMTKRDKGRALIAGG